MNIPCTKHIPVCLSQNRTTSHGTPLSMPERIQGVYTRKEHQVFDYATGKAALEQVLHPLYNMHACCLASDLGADLDHHVLGTCSQGTPCCVVSAYDNLQKTSHCPMWSNSVCAQQHTLIRIRLVAAHCNRQQCLGSGDGTSLAAF